MAFNSQSPATLERSTQVQESTAALIQGPPTDRPAERARLAWLAAFILSLTLYALTASREANWQDGGWQQLRIVTRELNHPRGLALIHPLHHYLGRAAVTLLPMLEPAFAITLVSALAGAIAVANLAAIILILTRMRWAATIAAASLALSHTFWQHATHTESYELVAALLTGEWLCLACYVVDRRPRHLYLLALLNGLGVSNHLLALLATPVDAFVVIHAIRRRQLNYSQALLSAGLWLLGAGLYISIVLNEAIRTRDLGATMHSALFGNFAPQVLNTDLEGTLLLRSLLYILYNFPGLTLPLALCFLASESVRSAAWRPGLQEPAVISRVWTAQLVLYLVFVARYSITDQYTFFIPVYCLLAALGGLGLAGMCRILGGMRRSLLVATALLTAFWTPIVYTAARSILASRGLFASQVGNKPYRDGYRAFFIPWGAGDDHATRLRDDVYALAGEKGLILVPDRMFGINFEYEQALGRGPRGLEIGWLPEQTIPEIISARRALLRSCLDSKRTVVFVPRDKDHPISCLPEARWRRQGDLYVLEGM